jgi:Flp pilus assembly protein TadD
MPEYAAALEQLYLLSQQPEEARKQRDLIDFVDRMGRLASEKTNRNLALIYADQGRNLDRALELVQEELKVRNDIYTHDALAWVLFQRKDYVHAEESARVALQLATPEPSFYYHAGRIAAARGKPDEARKLLNRARELNPNFDLRAAPLVAAALAK